MAVTPAVVGFRLAGGAMKPKTYIEILQELTDAFTASKTPSWQMNQGSPLIVESIDAALKAATFDMTSYIVALNYPSSHQPLMKLLYKLKVKGV